MLKFETFIFKNGKALDLYSKDGARVNKPSLIFVTRKQTADVLSVKPLTLNRWLQRQENCDNLSQNEGRGAENLVNYFTFIKASFSLYKGDGRAIAQELTDALAVYMTDANVYHQTNAIVDGNDPAVKQETFKHPQPYNSNLVTAIFGGQNKTRALLVERGWIVKTPRGYVATRAAIDSGFMTYQVDYQRAFEDSVTGRRAWVAMITPEGIEALKNDECQVDNTPLFNA